MPEPPEDAPPTAPIVPTSQLDEHLQQLYASALVEDGQYQYGMMEEDDMEVIEYEAQAQIHGVITLSCIHIFIDIIYYQADSINEIFAYFFTEKFYNSFENIYYIEGR